MKSYPHPFVFLIFCFGFLLVGYGTAYPQYSMPSSLNPFDAALPKSPRTISSFPNVPFPALALTFDDGPHPKYTPRLLEILDRYGVKATFFVIGRNVERYPELTQSIVSKGHQIANHTMTHPNLAKVKRKKLDSEIRDANLLIESYTGKKPTAIRPPYGSLNVKVEAALRNLYGLNIILWSVDPEDWKKPGASEIARRLIEGAKPGAILLAHDIHEQTIEAMPEVLSQLLSRGYKFGTIDQMMSLPSVPQNVFPHSSHTPQQPQSSHLPLPQLPQQVPVGQSAAGVVSGYKVPVLRALPVDP